MSRTHIAIAVDCCSVVAACLFARLYRTQINFVAGTSSYQVQNTSKKMCVRMCRRVRVMDRVSEKKARQTKTGRGGTVSQVASLVFDCDILNNILRPNREEKNLTVV